MAIIDTGLGWRADENWLKQSFGKMGEIEYTPDSLPTIPEIMEGSSTASEVVEKGLLCSQISNISSYALALYGNRSIKVGAVRTTPGGWIVSLCYVSIYALSTVATATQQTPYAPKNYATHPLNVASITVDDVTYGYANPSGTFNQENTRVPVFDTLEDLCRSYNPAVLHYPYYKMVTGYAISCFVKGIKNGTQTPVWIPVLISSNPLFCKMSNDDPSGAYAEDIAQKSTATYNGVEFTIGIGPEIEGGLTEHTGAYTLDLTTSGQLPQWNTPSYFLFMFQHIAKAASLQIWDPNNPYATGGVSESGGGDGTFDFESTDVNFPGIPQIGGYATGFTTMYNPTAAELKNLADYMWAGAFEIENFKKLFADPMDAIIGLSIIPLAQGQISGQSSTLVVGNVPTGISMKAVTSQYVKVNMGTVSVPPKWGAYLDYAPYTKLQLFLPYIGFVDIAPDDVVGYSITVEYTIDLMSGTCIALVKTNGHVLYSFGANCSCACPVTSGQYKNGAIGAVEIISSTASTVSQLVPSIKDVAKGPSKVAAISDKIAAGADWALNTFDTVQSMFKPAITRSGSIGSAVGLMGIQIPYLVLTIPRMCTPGEQNVYMGYPSFVTQLMNNLSGYTVVQVTHLNNMSCTASECAEIIALLEEGVIF